MDIFQTPLNTAHQHGRRADACVAQGNYQKALELHDAAAECLNKLLSSSVLHSEAMLSVRLQRDYHERQKYVIRDRQHRAEQQALQVQQAREERMRQGDVAHEERLHQGDGIVNTPDRRITVDDLDIHRHTSDFDTLLVFLRERSDSRSMRADGIHTLHGHIANYQVGVKAPKDAMAVVEELSELNRQLRSHAIELLRAAKQRDVEIQHCKENVECLLLTRNVLMERLAVRDRASNGVQHNFDHPVHFMKVNDKIAQDSCAYFTCDVDQSCPVLLDLPPLEPPLFDFDALKIGMSDVDDFA